MGYFAIRRMRERLQGAGAPEPPREEASTPEGPAGGTPLPEGFPARNLLLAHGYTTLEAVRDAPDDALLGIKGIGKKLLEEIRHALRQQG
ncbi:helix-hairpin-helix domain-containing protein [Thermus tengchongensis]|uniref:Helix-hairpin-helix domain-containing protein n=1 Tax=Thermus tengchongensis TaxID=1214928 RepID=A0A4Y9F8Z2_9DEIN|nr:helix-hairpin-helix domain-containing protein [Thermus tengchongensis]TFU25637.1 helix-hairpin-helix domain-containing protein [Thermus tengchongensis]